MRLLSYLHDETVTYGALVEGGVVDLGVRLGDSYRDIKAVISRNGYQEVQRALDAAQIDHQLDEIEFLPVIGNPGKILCVGLNYEAHRKETGRAKTEHPTIFTRFSDTLVGHERAATMPRVSDKLDYEGELAIIIGKAGRHIRRADAMSHIAGYSCFNDITVRDWQRHTIQFTPGKNFPGTGGFGPCFISADEIEDINRLDIQTRLNGVVMQDANTELLIHDLPAILEYVSAFTPLSPGDVIATGTPGGVGFKRDPQVFMKPGDEIVVEIEKIGLLRNWIADEPPAKRFGVSMGL